MSRKNPYYYYNTDRRERSEAWHMDGGANDEGYFYRYCSACDKETEHDLANCIPCGDMAAAVSARAQKLRTLALKKK